MYWLTFLTALLAALPGLLIRLLILLAALLAASALLATALLAALLILLAALILVVLTHDITLLREGFRKFQRVERHIGSFHRPVKTWRMRVQGVSKRRDQ